MILEVKNTTTKTTKLTKAVEIVTIALHALTELMTPELIKAATKPTTKELMIDLGRELMNPEHSELTIHVQGQGLIVPKLRPLISMIILEN